MSFKTILNLAMKDAGITGAELSRLTGIPPTTISDYRNGVNPSEHNLKLIESILSIPEEPKEAPKIRRSMMSVEEAARLMNMPVSALKKALRKDFFRPQIGYARKLNNNWRYYMFPKRVEAYINAVDFRQ